MSSQTQKSRILLTTEQASEILTIAVKTLERWRCQGKGPTYLKVEGAVRYLQTDLFDYIDACRTSTNNGSD
jgi:predicted site-specific integrase-resolvase